MHSFWSYLYVGNCKSALKMQQGQISQFILPLNHHQTWPFPVVYQKINSSGASPQKLHIRYPYPLLFAAQGFKCVDSTYHEHWGPCKYEISVKLSLLLFYWERDEKRSVTHSRPQTMSPPMAAALETDP